MINNCLQNLRDDLLCLPRDRKGPAASNRDVQNSAKALLAVLNDCDSETLRTNALLIQDIREEYLQIRNGKGFDRFWNTSKTETATLSVLRKIDDIFFKDARKDAFWKAPIYDLVKRNKLSKAKAERLIQQILDHYTIGRSSEDQFAKPFIFETGTSQLIFEFGEDGSIHVPGLNPESLSLAKKANLTLSDAIAIYRFIELYKNSFHEQAVNEKRNIVVHRRVANIPRSIQFNKNGHVWILLNRERAKDRVLGFGTTKSVKRAVRAHTLEFCARSVMKVDKTTHTSQAEIEFATLFGDKTEGVVKTYSTVNAYIGKDGVEKASLIQKEYDCNLDSSLAVSWPFTPSQRTLLAKDMLTGLANIHKAGVIHRDIKPQNIFLYADQSGDPRADIGDFDLSCYSTAEMDGFYCTEEYVAPEYSKAYLEDEDYSKINEKIDIYSMGLSFCELFNTSPEELTSAPNKTKIQKTILAMLDRDPAKRPTAEEALQVFRAEGSL